MTKNQYTDAFDDFDEKEIDELIDKVIDVTNDELQIALDNDIVLYNDEESMKKLFERFKTIATELAGGTYNDDAAEYALQLMSMAEIYLDDISDEADEDIPDANESLDETVATKHKITRVQSILDKRRRKVDAKLKRQRRMTLMRKKARGGRIINRKLSRGLKKSRRQGFGKRWEEWEEIYGSTLFSEMTADEKEEEMSEKLVEDASTIEPEKKGKGHISDEKEEKNLEKDLEEKDENDVEDTSDDTTSDDETEESCKKNEDDCDSDDCDDDDCDCKKDEKNESVVIDTAVLQSILEDVLDTRIEVIKEKASENYNKTAFGTLTEAESTELRNLVTESIVEGVRENGLALVERFINETQRYADEVIVPSINENVDNYIVDEVMPEFEKDINKYLEYVVEELSTNLANNKQIVKSRKSMQLEAFADKLFNLIHDELNIVPEQEDALIEAESKIAALEKSLDERITQNVALKKQLRESERMSWVKDNIPDDFSEIGKEHLLEEVKTIDASTFEGFKAEFASIVKSMSGDVPSVNEQAETKETKSDNKSALNMNAVMRLL